MNQKKNEKNENNANKSKSSITNNKSKSNADKNKEQAKPKIKEDAFVEETGEPELEPEKDFLTMEEIGKLFKMIDQNRNGYITVEEIKLVFSQFQIDVDFDDCQAVLTAFDQNGYGKLLLQDFYREMSDIITEEPTEEQIQMVFNGLDNDRNGFIGPDEIKEQFKTMGVEITEKEAIDTIVAMDKTGYGIVDYETFKEYFKSTIK